MVRTELKFPLEQTDNSYSAPASCDKEGNANCYCQVLIFQEKQENSILCDISKCLSKIHSMISFRCKHMNPLLATYLWEMNGYIHKGSYTRMVPAGLFIKNQSEKQAKCPLNTVSPNFLLIRLIESRTTLKKSLKCHKAGRAKSRHSLKFWSLLSGESFSVREWVWLSLWKDSDRAVQDWWTQQDKAEGLKRPGVSVIVRWAGAVKSCQRGQSAAWI